MSLVDRLNQRIAAAAFDGFASNGCIIESDGEGPSLWNAARKAAVTGLAALTLFTAVAPAYSADVQMPPEQAAATFQIEVNDALAANDGWFDGNNMTGIKTRDMPWVSQFQAVKERDSTPLFGNIEFTHPLAGKSCVISYGTGNPSPAYTSALDLPADFDIGGYEQMRAVSFCALWGLLPGKSWSQHYDSAGGPIQAADTLTALATAKYDSAAFDGVYSLQGALALSQLRDGDAFGQASALSKLEALGKMHGYVHSEDGSRSLTDASVSGMAEVSDMLVRASQQSVAESGIQPGAAAAMPISELKTALQDAGLDGAARALSHVEQSGLSKEGGYFETMRKEGCQDIQRVLRSRENRAKFICQLAESLNLQDWKVGGDAGFSGDFNTYANFVLGGQQQTLGR